MKRKFLHALLPGACLAIVAATMPVQMLGQNRDFHAERIVLDDAAGDGGFNSMTLQVPGTGLTANRTLTFPDADGSIVTQASPLVANQILFGGPAGQAAQSANLLFDDGTGTFNIGAGNFTVAAATGNLATTGNIQADGTIQSGSSIIIDGTTPGSHNITATAGENLTITPSGGTLFVNAPVFNHGSGLFTVDPGAINYNAGALNVTAVTFSTGSGLFTVDPGAINYNGGALNVTPVTFSTGSGLFSVDPGSISYNAGLFTVDPGTMSYSGSVFTVPGIFTVTPGPTLTLNGLFTVDPGAMNYNSGAFVVTPIGGFQAAGPGSTVGDGNDAEQLEVNGVDGGAIEVDVNGDMDVSGTLTAGTLGLGFTQGSVPFADATGSLDENNGAFFWDNANERLGAGTNTPSAVIHGLSTDVAEPAIRGDNVASGVGVAGISDLLGVQGQTGTGTGVYAVATGTGTGLNGTSDLGVAATFSNTNAANTNAVVEITNIGSGVSLTVAPGTGGDAVDVNGNILSSGGNVTVDDNLDVTGTVDANTLTDGAGSTITGGAATFNTITGAALPAASTSTDLVTSNAGALETRTVASLTGLIGVSSDATLTGDGTTGNPLGIDLTNANSWTGAQTFSSVDINGGTIDGTTIGGTTPAAGTFTAISDGAGATITGGTVTATTLTDGIASMSGGTISDGFGASMFGGTVTGFTLTDGIASMSGGTISDGFGASMFGGTVTGFTLTDGIASMSGGTISDGAGASMTGGTVTGTTLTDGIASMNGGTISDGAGSTITGGAGTFATITGTGLPAASTSTDIVTSNGGGLETRTAASLAGTIGVSSDATLTGDGTTGSPLGIDLTNANSWTGAQTFSSVDVNGGTVDGTAIGATAPSTGAFTTITGTSSVTLGDDTTPTPGSVILHDNTAANTFTGTLQVTNPLTANRTYTFPDADGTLALVGDIVTNSTLLGDGTGGDPLRINLSNTNTWTGTQTFGQVAVLSIATFDADVTLGDSPTDALTANGTFAGATPLAFEGATSDVNETTFAITDPTADRTITFQDASGTVAFLSDIAVTTNSTLLGDGTGGDPLRINLSNANTWTGTQTFGQVAVLSIATFDADVTLGDSPTDALTANGTFAGATPLSFEGATSDVNETTFAITDPTADRTITFQDASGTVAFLSDIAVTTNSTLLGDGSGGDPLRINLSNANTWTGAQTFTSFSDFQGPIGSTVGDLQIGDGFFVNSGGATDMRFDEASIVRNSGASETIAIDNPGAGDISILVNGAGAVANSRLTINDGHWTSQQTTAPVGAAAGANVTSAALSNETDVAGLVDITTSGTPAAGAQATITFDAAYGTAPIVVLTAANGAAAGIGAHVTRTTAGFTISFIGVPAASTSYQFFYQVIETQ